MIFRNQALATCISVSLELSLHCRLISPLADEEEIDFEGFVKIMRAGSVDSLDHLDQYDARLSMMASPSGRSLADLVDR